MAYDPDQPRDKTGEWAAGASMSGDTRSLADQKSAKAEMASKHADELSAAAKTPHDHDAAMRAHSTAERLHREAHNAHFSVAEVRKRNAMESYDKAMSHTKAADYHRSKGDLEYGKSLISR